LVFLDESGFLLLPTVRCTWAPRGQTPVVRHRYERTKISAISAVTVSPQRHCCGLYACFHFDNISHLEVAHFLRLLLRHLRGEIILLWDGGSIHRGEAVRAVLARHPRLHVERFPAYAPELNPDEQVWGHLKGRLANGCPDTAEELLDELTRVTRALRRQPQLLRNFIRASDLPPFFSS
jgi:transposase